MKHRQLVPSLGVMLAGAFWGLLWLPLVEFDKLGIGVGISSLIFYAVTALCTLPGLFITGAWRQVFQSPKSLVIMGVAFTLYTFALLLTNPFNAILLFYLTPAWSILLGRFLYGEAISFLRILVIILGFVGVGCVLGATSVPLPKNLGDWIALSSGMLWALATSLTSREAEKNSWVRLLQFSISGLLSTLILAILLIKIAPTVLATSTDVMNYFWLSVIGLLLFTIPNLLVVWGSSQLSSTRVGVLLMMEVVVGTIAIANLSDQSITAIQIIGAILIFSAGVVEVLSRDSKASSHQ